ncbi:MAG: hypothetical protein AB1898_32970 [Acidobacteriota bacterium]
MITFDVSLNGEPLCLAGIPRHGVLSVIANWVHRRSSASSDEKDERWIDELSFSVGGLERNPSDVEAEYLHWVKRDLKPGDILTIRVVESDTADEPASREREDPAQVSEQQRKYYLKLKKEFEPSGIQQAD